MPTSAVDRPFQTKLESKMHQIATGIDSIKILLGETNQLISAAEIRKSGRNR